MQSESSYSNTLRLASAITGVRAAAVAFSAALLVAENTDYPQLHLILDMGLFVLSGVQALFFWNVGGRPGQPFPQWIATTLAITWVYRRGGFSNRNPEAPLVVLLDITMPKINGLEVLEKMKGDPDLRMIPVVMLTSPREGPDVEPC